MKKQKVFRSNYVSLSDNEFEAFLQNRLHNEITAMELFKEARLKGFVNGMAYGLMLGFVIGVLVFAFAR